jgi:hypothetical protein
MDVVSEGLWDGGLLAEEEEKQSAGNDLEGAETSGMHSDWKGGRSNLVTEGAQGITPPRMPS